MLTHTYAAILQPIAKAVAFDMIRVSAPATASIVVLRASVTQTGSETSDQVQAVIRRASANGTGSANTPLAYSAQSPAFPGSAVDNLSAIATASDELYREAFNLLNGFLWVPVPEERIIVPPSGRIVLRLDTAPAASTTMTACLVVGVVG